MIPRGGPYRLTPDKGPETMKHRLTLKFIAAYAVFGVLAFLAVAVFGSRLCRKSAVKTASEELYREVRTIASAQSASYTSGRSFDPAHLSFYQSVSDCRVLILDGSARVLYDSGVSGYASLAGQTLAFDPADSPEYYRIGRFGSAFREDMLGAFSPITARTTTYGYAMVLQQMSTVNARADAMLGNIYLICAAVFVMSFLPLAVMYFAVQRPLGRITDGAQEYAQGHLAHRIPVKSRDEVGYLAASLNAMAAELQSADETQKKFIANVSHDFRSPLTSIRGYLQAMKDGVIPPEKQEKYMDIIIGETDRLTNLTQSMLTLNTLDESRQGLEYSDFDMVALTKTVCATFGAVCERRDILFDLIFSEARIDVHADMGRIQQVMMNLIDNAIKFSPDSSAIRISVRGVGDKAAVSVKDFGCGIEKEDLGHIWTRFYKTDSSRGRDKKGTGLGLSIVKEIITAHGETIDVISTPGSGTEFIFRLPLAK